MKRSRNPNYFEWLVNKKNRPALKYISSSDKEEEKVTSSNIGAAAPSNTETASVISTDPNISTNTSSKDNTADRNSNNSTAASTSSKNSTATDTSVKDSSSVLSISTTSSRAKASNLRSNLNL